jgi:cobalt-zinc-cadmium efflux system membrane fusion protein
MMRPLAGRRLAALALLPFLLSAPARAEKDHDHDEHAHHDDHAGHDDHDHDGHDDHAGHDDHDDHAAPTAVALDGATREEFGIEMARAGSGTIRRAVVLAGEIHPNDDRLAHIVPRYAGIVTEVRAQLGDRVDRGQVLAVVESDESLAPFEVRTLIGGIVIEKHVTLGEAVDRGRDAFTIADLSTVWVDLAVHQRDLDAVRAGRRVEVLVGHEPSGDDATIDYVTPILEEATRTATARVVLPNARGRWRPGMFVNARVYLEETTVAVAVPPTALHRRDGALVVFVEEADGLVPREVHVGREGEELVEILEGLDAGESYVVRGGFTLKAELEKGSFGHGHSH